MPVSLPPRPPLLAGREDLLAELHGALSSGGTPRMVVLCGLGGVGKTSLAAEYAHRHLAEVGVAWQVRAEDPTALAADMAELAAQLGAREAADLRDPVASVHAVLAAYPAEWLLVFDNAPDEECVRRFLPPAGRGWVLITSQSAHWPGIRALEVPVLHRDVAAGFLANRTGDPDHAAARDLAAELGGLPLALEQAAAYMRATADTAIARYLAQFRQRRLDLLDRGQAAGHPGSVAATLGLALTRLQEGAPAAAGLLRLLAYLAPEPVPAAVLLSDPGMASQLRPAAASALGPLFGDDLAADDAVAELRRYSLVTPAGPGMVLMHRLVQAVTLAQLPQDEAAAWREAAAVLVEAALPADTSMPANWPTYAALLPHAQAALSAQGDGMGKIASYLRRSCKYSAARDLYRQVMEAREQDLGSEHLRTLDARHYLARMTGEAGDRAGARDMLAALLPVDERVRGPEHPDTLATRRELARWTGRAGDPAGARDMFAALLTVRERVSGAEHPDTLAARASLAHWTGEAGDPAGARDMLAALLPVDERVNGPEHPDTLTDRANLAYLIGQARDPAGARDMLAALLPVQERVLGAQHPDTLATRRSLAYWTRRQNEPTQQSRDEEN